MTSRRRPLSTVASLLFVASLAAGCGAAGVSTAQPSAAPSAPASAEPSDAASVVPGGEVDLDTPTACVGLGATDCERARALAATALGPGDPPAVYVQVGPFGCVAGDRCPTTLAARPEGDVVVEWPGGTAIAIHLAVAPDGTFDASRGEAFGIALEPTSVPGLAAGPVQYTLGHCGVFSGIDVGGSWWDPVGPVDLDSGDAINATTGVLTVTDPDHASFTTPTGFAVQLQRRDGPKFLPLCQ